MNYCKASPKAQVINKNTYIYTNLLLIATDLFVHFPQPESQRFIIFNVVARQQNATIKSRQRTLKWNFKNS